MPTRTLRERVEIAREIVDEYNISGFSRNERWGLGIQTLAQIIPDHRELERTAMGRELLSLNRNVKAMIGAIANIYEVLDVREQMEILHPDRKEARLKAEQEYAELDAKIEATREKARNKRKPE